MNKSIITKVIEESPDFTESRKKSLYSNFARLKDYNPEGYAANINAWARVLTEVTSRAAFEHKTVIPAGPKLVDSFQDPENGWPLALDAVLDEMLAKGEIVPEKQFLNAPGSVAQVGSWLLRAVGLISPETSSNKQGLKPVNYVVEELAQRAATSILLTCKALSLENGGTYTSQVFSNEEVVARVAESEQGNKYSPLDVQIALKTLQKDSKIDFDAGKQIIKLSPSGAAVKLNENDFAIPSLRRAIDTLTIREERLENDAAKAQKSAKLAVTSGRKSAARDYLRRKQAAEGLMEQVIEQKRNLQTLLFKIDEATNNQLVFEALQIGQQALQTLNANANVDKIHELKDEIHENMDGISDVSQALASMAIGDLGVDDSEIEAELELLEKETKEKKKLDALPRAPSLPPQANRNGTPSRAGSPNRLQVSRSPEREMLPA